MAKRDRPHLMDRAHWRVSGVRDLPAFLSALPALLPADSILRLELDAHPDEDIARFLSKFAIPSSMTRNRGTLWPRSELHHVPIRPDVMSALAELAAVRAEHDVADHMIAYRGDDILLEWYDAIFDPISISGAIDEGLLSAFARSVGGVLEDVERPNEPDGRPQIGLGQIPGLVPAARGLSGAFEGPDAVAEPVGHASEKLRTPEAHWLFKRVADRVECLCVLELSNGEYWVVDSPTGTYMSGHADRGHWHLAEAEYLAQGYVRQLEAKSRGLIPPSWSRATPDPTRLVARRHRVRATILALLIITGVVILALFVPRLIMGVIGQ